MSRVVFLGTQRRVPTPLRAAISPVSTVKIFWHPRTTNSSVSQSANTDRRNNLNSMLAFYWMKLLGTLQMSMGIFPSSIGQKSMAARGKNMCVLCSSWWASLLFPKVEWQQLPMGRKRHIIVVRKWHQGCHNKSNCRIAVTIVPTINIYINDLSSAFLLYLFYGTAF